MLERIQSMETSLWFKLKVGSDEVKTSSRMTVLWLRSLLVHILRFLLLALLSAQTHKPQCIGSQTQTKRTTFAVSRDLESQNTWAMQPERMERTATPNPFCTTERKGKEQGFSS